MNHLISIIIPIYNVEDYVERSIRSVLCQTYRNIEVVLVDDCSTDRSMKIAHETIKQSPLSHDIRFVFHRLEHNSGASAARNIGINVATGDYLFFFDSDDELPATAIESLYAEVIKHPATEMVQGVMKPIPYRSYYDLNLTNLPLYSDDNWLARYYFFYRPIKRITIHVTNKLWLKSFITTNRLFFKEGIVYEDELWAYKAIKYLKHFCMISEVTYIHYTDIKGSVMNNESPQRRARISNIILLDVVKELDEPLRDLQLLTYTQWMLQFLNPTLSVDKKISLRFAFQHMRHFHLNIAAYLILFYYWYPHGGRRLNKALSKQLDKYANLETQGSPRHSQTHI